MIYGTDHRKKDSHHPVLTDDQSQDSGKKKNEKIIRIIQQKDESICSR
jgi:hypothetical protein